MRGQVGGRGRQAFRWRGEGRASCGEHRDEKEDDYKQIVGKNIPGRGGGRVKT